MRRHSEAARPLGILARLADPRAGVRRGGRVQVTNVRTTVVGTPWRDLVFVELETDTGLTGVGEVRPVNKTDSFVAMVDELAGPLRRRCRPVRHRAAGLGDRAPRVRPTERARPVRAGRVRHRRRGTSSASSSASRSGSCSAVGSGPRPGVCQRLVPGRLRAGPHRGAGSGRGRARLPGDEARPVRGGERPAVGRATGAARSRSSPRSARRRPGHRPDDRDARPLLARHRRPGRGRARAVRAALDRGAGPARERGRPGARPAGDERSRSRPANGSTRSGMRPRSSRAATSTSSRPT